MDIPKEALLLNTRNNPNSFFFLRYIALNYRLNEGKKRQDIISIKTLISKSPELPLYEDVMNSDRAYNRRIVQRTFRDLDVINTISYKVHTMDGEEVSDPYSLSYEDFISCKIAVDYSEWPTHHERLEARQRHVETAQKRK